MSIVFPKPGASVVVRGKEAEVVGSPKAAVRLLVDSGSTGGALSTVQVSRTRARTAQNRIDMSDRRRCSMCSKARSEYSPVRRSSEHNEAT
jgi:hypothetical protein